MPPVETKVENFSFLYGTILVLFCHNPPTPSSLRLVHSCKPPVGLCTKKHVIWLLLVHWPVALVAHTLIQNGSGGENTSRFPTITDCNLFSTCVQCTKTLISP